MAWTADQVEHLKRLWHEGFSTAEIGRQLGISKNAVVGKSHRLGLSPRPSPIRRSARPTVRAAKASPVRAPEVSVPATPATPSPVPAAAPEPTPAAAPANGATNGKVVDLTGPRCAWPIGDPREPDFHFCSHRAIPGKPYCLDHYKIAYIPGSSKNDKVDAA